MKRFALPTLPALVAALWLAGCASTIPVPTAPQGIPAPGAAPAAVTPHAPAPAAAAVATVEATPPAPVEAPVAVPPPVEAAMAPMASIAPTAPPPMAEAIEPPLIEGDRSNLWDRIRSRWGVPDLDGDRVRRWEQHYAQRPEYVERMLQRGGRYLYHVIEEVEKRGLPAELALLPVIESAFNPQALSRARASGLWQFMPATGRDFALRQNLFRDDRRGVTASTGAALDYLKSLHARFGNWHLALAAYNWGQGNVARAIKRNERLGLPTGYAHLQMPNETRDYVPKLQAVKNIVVDAARLGLELPPLENHPFFARVRIERDIDVALAAELAEVPLAEFQALNPQLNKPVILAAGTPEVLLPWDRAEPFRQRLALAPGPLSSWTAWVAPRTMKPAEAARTVAMPEGELREINRIPAGMLIKAGSTLLVPRPASQEDDVSARLADHSQLVFAPEARGQRRLTVRIGRRGESLVSVARRHRVTPVQLARWNGVSPRAQFKPGQSVIVMAPAPRQAKATRAASKARLASARQPGTKKAKAATKPAPRKQLVAKTAVGKAPQPR